MLRLETNRLLLREWQTGDIDDLVDGLNNIEVSKWLAYIPYPYTTEDAKNWVEFCSGNPVGAYYFAIELKSEKKVIGGTSLEKIHTGQGISGGGGIWIHAKYHGFGYGAEAFGKRIEFAFRQLNLRRLENGFFDGNTSSWKMQERFGYKIEGKRRKGFLCMANGEYKDEITTALLKEEWITDEYICAN